MTNPEVERAGLMQTSRDWAHAAASGDLERAVAYWTEDASIPGFRNRPCWWS